MKKLEASDTPALRLVSSQRRHDDVEAGYQQPDDAATG
jgi:hypothetical protein